MITLEDLKRAVEVVGDEPPMFGDEPLVDNYARISEYHRRRANAWRSAFEWREGWHIRREQARYEIDNDYLIEEGRKGMTLIERLK